MQASKLVDCKNRLEGRSNIVVEQENISFLVLEVYNFKVSGQEKRNPHPGFGPSTKTGSRASGICRNWQEEELSFHDPSINLLEALQHPVPSMILCDFKMYIFTAKELDYKILRTDSFGR